VFLGSASDKQWGLMLMLCLTLKFWWCTPEHMIQWRLILISLVFLDIEIVAGVLPSM
jgi:hypothetical protein